jgi:hypothetical protein
MEKIIVKPRVRDEVHARPREQLKVRAKVRDSVIARPINALWERRGWQVQQTPRGPAYSGQYQTIDPRSGLPRHFEGRIETGGGNCLALLRHPPTGLLNRHPKRMCFHNRNQGWYSMNWWQGTSDIDETIGYVEKTLAEALALG